MNDFLKKYLIDVIRISKVKDYTIVEDKEGKKYLILRRDKDVGDIYSYLEEIGYPYYLSILNHIDENFLLYPYYSDRVDDISYKAKLLLEGILFLQLKSIEYKDTSLEFISTIYEKSVNELDSLMDYYSKLQENMEKGPFSPSTYFLLNHISEFYQNIEYSRREIENFFQYQEMRIRTSYQIGNVCLSNFRVGEKKYFLNLLNMKKDLLSLDLISFYRMDGLSFDMISLFDLYQAKIPFDSSELSFFFSKVLIPDRLELSNSSYLDTIKIRREIDYLRRVREFYLEENKKYQETNQEKFKEKNEDI